MATLVDSMSDAELSDLAQLYVNATTDNGFAPKLLYVLAHRLDARRLGRMASHFGFAQVYAAVTAVAPGKSEEFIASSRVDWQGPIPGEMRFGPAGRFAPLVDPTKAVASRSSSPGVTLSERKYVVFRPSDERADSSVAIGGRLHKVAGFGQFMNMTPYEIHLDFRTAPVGALGVTGALWETSVVLSSTLIPAYATGYAIGTTVVAPLIQTYAPSLYDTIGSTIGTLVDTLTNSWSGGTTSAGNAQKSTAPTFQPTSSQIDQFESVGGDYGAAEAWSESTGGGGGCRDSCYPQDEH